MAVTTDLGDRTTVHPQRKEPVGDRLSLAARALVYGQKVEYTGPVLVSTKLEGAALRITFSHAEGLHAIEVRDGSDSGEVIASADKLTGFEIAGSDKKYYRADATIAGSTVVLSSPNVPMPVAARYAWANYDVGNLSNGAGLPASPFTTDDWAWSTAPKSPAIPAK
jgi:sialate O-acetylesterase